jgi:ABC-type amino acid transport substrate-binding protein
VTGIQFSQPFFYTGTHLLTQATRSADFDPEATLEGVRLGVLQDTTTEAFIRDRYPNADLVFFDGAAGTLKGVQGVTDGSLDAFADDGLLLLGVGLQQGLPAENYALLPETPLTCDGYGLVLAGGDRQWQDLVNTFLRSRSARQVRDTWLSRFFPAELDILNACFSTAEP